MTVVVWSRLLTVPALPALPALSTGVGRVEAGVWAQRFAGRPHVVSRRASRVGVHRGVLARNPSKIQVFIVGVRDLLSSAELQSAQLSNVWDFEHDGFIPLTRQEQRGRRCLRSRTLLPFTFVCPILQDSRRFSRCVLVVASNEPLSLFCCSEKQQRRAYLFARSAPGVRRCPYCTVSSVVPLVVRRCVEDTTVCEDGGKEHFIPKGCSVHLLIKARTQSNPRTRLVAVGDAPKLKS